MANNNKNRVPLSFNKAKDMYHKSDVVIGDNDNEKINLVKEAIKHLK